MVQCNLCENAKANWIILFQIISSKTLLVQEPNTS